MLSVMTFNIRYRLAEDGINNWEFRKPLVIERIRAIVPDLIGMQECRDDAQAAFIKAALPEYHFFGVRRGGDDETTLEMAPVLVRKGAFDVEEQGVFWLSETPDVAGSKSWKTTFARTVTWARLQVKGGGKRFLFLNTHFDYIPEAILGSARFLARWAAENGQMVPLILTGDFNADKDSSAYKILTEQGNLRDAYRAVHPHPDDETTLHGYGNLEERTSIDWILVSDAFGVNDAQIDRAHSGKRYPSDHYPVTVTLDWATRESGRNVSRGV